MKFVLLALFIAVTFVYGNDGDKVVKLPSLFAGTYEFEIMGSPYRMYICECEESKQTYWSVADIHDNEYTVGMYEIYGFFLFI